MIRDTHRVYVPQWFEAPRHGVCPRIRDPRMNPFSGRCDVPSGYGASAMIYFYGIHCPVPMDMRAPACYAILYQYFYRIISVFARIFIGCIARLICMARMFIRCPVSMDARARAILYQLFLWMHCPVRIYGCMPAVFRYSDATPGLLLTACV